MREFDFNASASKLLTNNIVNMLGNIHEYKGQQNLFIEAKADVLTHLLEIAKKTVYGGFQPNRGHLCIRRTYQGSGKGEVHTAQPQ